jgi:hypothetical protein
MIKSYIDFIKESDEFNSLGEWVELLYNDEYIKNIVNRYVKDISGNIRLSNAINTLDIQEKKEIKSQIDEYLTNGIQDKDTQVIASTDIDLLESQVVANKGTFTCFLKTITALGLKEMRPNIERCSSTYLLFYYFPNLPSEDIKNVFSRFISLSKFIDMIDYSKNEVGLYYGVKCDGTFEYGIAYDKLNAIGSFKLTSSILKWIINLELKSAASLKKELVNLTINDLILFGKIKQDMEKINPGYHEKREKPFISDKIITFTYYGLGKYDSGKIDTQDFQDKKVLFSNFISSKKWGQKVLFNLKSESFNMILQIKLK